jgi:hypothetical protein
VIEMIQNWVKIETVYDQIQAELLRGLLEAQEVNVLLAQEGAAKALGLSVGTLSEIEVLVAERDAKRARMILDEYYGGELEE